MADRDFSNLKHVVVRGKQAGKATNKPRFRGITPVSVNIIFDQGFGNILEVCGTTDRYAGYPCANRGCRRPYHRPY